MAMDAHNAHSRMPASPNLPATHISALIAAGTFPRRTFTARSRSSTPRATSCFCGPSNTRTRRRRCSGTPSGSMEQARVVGGWVGGEMCWKQQACHAFHGKTRTLCANTCAQTNAAACARVAMLTGKSRISSPPSHHSPHSSHRAHRRRHPAGSRHDGASPPLPSL